MRRVAPGTLVVGVVFLLRHLEWGALGEEGKGGAIGRGGETV